MPCCGSSVDKLSVVVIGGGYAGTEVANGLDTSKFDVTLISAKDQFVAFPILPACLLGRVSGDIPESSLAANFVKPGHKFIHGLVVGVDIASKTLRYTAAAAEGGQSQNPMTIKYDRLVIAAGGVENTYNISGVREHAFFYRSFVNVRTIRKALLDRMAEAKALLEAKGPDADTSGLLSVTIVGGGPTGVEIAAELGDSLSQALKGELRRSFPEVAERIKVTLVQSGDALLPGFDHAEVSAAAKAALEAVGVGLRLNTRVTAVGADSVTVSHQSTTSSIPSAITIWAVGTSPAPITRVIQQAVNDAAAASAAAAGSSPSSAAPTDDTLTVDGFLRVVGAEQLGVYALGDCIKYRMDKASDDAALVADLVAAAAGSGNGNKRSADEAIRSALCSGFAVQHAPRYPQLSVWFAANADAKKKGAASYVESGNVVSPATVAAFLAANVDTLTRGPVPSAMHAKESATYLVNTHFNKRTSAPLTAAQLFTVPPIMGIAYVGNGVSFLRKGDGSASIGGAMMGSVKEALMAPPGNKRAYWGQRLFGSSRKGLMGEADIVPSSLLAYKKQGRLIYGAAPSSPSTAAGRPVVPPAVDVSDL